MPASGGSVSDNTVPKTKNVNGQSHYLAYITPDEGKSLTDQGGREVITDSGIPAYPGHFGVSGESMGVPQGPQGRADGPRAHHGGGGGALVVTPSKADLGDIDAEDEYLAPDKDHWKATQKAIGKGIKDLGDQYQADWSDWTKEQQDTYQDEMNTLKGTEDVNYSFYKGNEGTTNLTFGEHWKDAVIKHPALKYSPTARFLYTAALTGKENLTTDYGTSKYGGVGASGSGRAVDQGGWWGRAKGLLEGSGAQDITTPGAGADERAAMNIIAPHAPYIVSGTTKPTNSPAANWFANLGKTSTNPGTFDLATEYAAAKSKVAQTLGTPSAIGQLAVNQSPFYNWLKDNSLDKGIL